MVGSIGTSGFSGSAGSVGSVSFCDSADSECNVVPVGSIWVVILYPQIYHIIKSTKPMLYKDYPTSQQIYPHCPQKITKKLFFFPLFLSPSPIRNSKRYSLVHRGVNNFTHTPCA
jgi:hypothetical protein